MKEIIARTIANYIHGDKYPWPPGYSDTRLEQEDLLLLATEILAAISNPTKEMCNAGTKCLCLDWNLTADGRVSEDVYKTMLIQAQQ